MRNFFQWKAREVRLFEPQFLASTSCYYKIQIWPGIIGWKSFIIPHSENWKNFKAEDEIEDKNNSLEQLVLIIISLANWLELEGTKVYRKFPMKVNKYCYRTTYLCSLPFQFVHSGLFFSCRSLSIITTRKRCHIFNNNTFFWLVIQW